MQHDFLTSSWESALAVNVTQLHFVSLRGWSKSRGGGGGGGKWGVGQQVLSLSKGWVTQVFSQWWGGS